MEIDVQAIHFTADGKLVDFIKKKLEKLTQFHHKILDTHVYLKIDRAEEHNNKITEVKLHIPNHILFAKEQCNSFEEAADLAIESLRRQLIKIKEKEAA
jgi:putative sigma-54 modulation protein